MANVCVFCERIAMASATESSLGAVAIDDAFPVSPGHTLVIPRRHVPSFFELEPGEQEDLWRLVGRIRQELSTRLMPDGFNIGMNAGAAAGQTIDHAHVHVIPRFVGDVPDPRGGIRWVVPERARYW